MVLMWHLLLNDPQLEENVLTLSRQILTRTFFDIWSQFVFVDILFLTNNCNIKSLIKFLPKSINYQLQNKIVLSIYILKTYN